MIRWKHFRAEIDTLARAWLDAGASAFALCEDDQLLMSLPRTLPAENPGLTATASTLPTLKALVWGGVAPGQAAHLQADAHLLAALFTQDREVDSVTAALVEHQDQLLTLYDLQHTLRPHLKLEAALSAIADAARQMLQVGAAAILFNDGKTLHRFHTAAYEHSAVLESVALQTLERGTHEQYAATFCLPMQIRGELRAVLLWQGRIFNSPDIKLMTAVAEQAAAHLETVVFYRETLERERADREMELARQVQSYLLPRRAPTVRGLDIFASSIPALSVGGDYYDFLQSACGNQLFVVGDVSGKGVPAALIMSMLRSALRSAVDALKLSSPSALIEHLSNTLYDDFTEIGVFATLFIARVDPDCREITIANAGHSPVLYHAPGASAQLLEADGLPVGALPSNFCEDHTLPFVPGCSLVIATDGFSETFAPSGEIFGYDRLLHLTEKTAAVSAQDSAAAFFGAVRYFRDQRPQDDDQTLMIIKRMSAE
ncbi:MAG: PP2C family protein-serine/threonine phosphatase [Chloroflexi bacterium]|nr:PP2C family protein-serine/threonine phosphatase [Chloroflexota bacterium]